MILAIIWLIIWLWLLFIKPPLDTRRQQMFIDLVDRNKNLIINWKDSWHDEDLQSIKKTLSIK